MKGAQRFRTAALAAGVLGFAAWGAGLFFAPKQALGSYLVAVVFLTSIQLGALLFLMTGHAMSASWVTVVRPAAEALSLTLPFTAILFLPVLIGVGELYPWAAAGVELGEKAFYLSPTPFRLRAVFYFVLWSAAAALVVRGIDVKTENARSRVASCAGLPLVGLSLTFAAFDWLMSLEPGWFSSAFGVYFFSGSIMSSVALLALLAAVRKGVAGVELTPHHYHALGRLLFGLLVFWAYIGYFQYFLIYIANRPSEVTHYVARVQTSYRALGTLLIVGHFAVPFFLLLSKRVKRTRSWLGAISAWLLVMHYVDVYWLVMPAVRTEGLRPDPLDLAALVGVSGLCAGFYSFAVRRRVEALRGSPELATALTYRSWT